MAKTVGVDKWLYFATLGLVVIGLAMVFSASAVMARENFGSPYYFLTRQAVYAGGGLVCMTLLMKVNYGRYNRPSVVFPMVGITIMLLLAAFLMRDSHNTHRWIRFGPLSFQPSEFAKPALVLFLAWFLQNRMGTIENVRQTILPAALPSLIFIALILKEPDLGTALVCAGVTALMLYLAGAQVKYFFIAGAAAAPVLYYMLFHVAFRKARMLAFVNPELDPKGAGFHILQSLIAVGTGGVWGRGLMEGVQKLFYLPEPHTDFIYSVISEELGLIGATAVLACFCVITWRGLRVSLRAPDSFGAFLALGLTAMVAVQALVNISVVLGLMPTKGIPLPFVSFGGSSLLINLVGMGILLNVSQHASPEA